MRKKGVKMAKKEKQKLNVIIRFSDAPENSKDIADLFLLLNDLDQKQNKKLCYQ